MKLNKVLIFLVVFSLLPLSMSGCSLNAKPNTAAKGKVSILFVGNSLTYSGDVPEQIKNLAGMYGIEIEYETICPPGAKLEETKNEAVEKMQNNKFDYAVFQEGSARPMTDNYGFLNDVNELCEQARKNGAAPVLYSPSGFASRGKPDKFYEGLIIAAYEEAAQTNDAILVNAAAAWAYTYEKFPDISLYVENDYHANEAGAYLTACVFVSTLFDLHVKDVADDNLYTGDEATELGQAAWEFVSYYKKNGESPAKAVKVPSGKNKKVNVKLG